MSRVAVLGATSFVGPFLLDRLAAAGHGGLCLVRQIPAKGSPLPPGFEWWTLDEDGLAKLPPGSAVLSLAPITVLAPLLAKAPLPAQVIAVSTTSVFTKGTSDDIGERRLAAEFRAAEAAVERACERHRSAWTILRPTMVYDGRHDQNVAAVARFIGRFGFFPVLGPARGLRQPIHADDVASAMVAALGNGDAADRAFTIAGGETLTYREMLERIGKALGRSPRTLPVPEAVLRLILGLGGALGFRGYTLSMFERMNHDMAFDDSEARRVLGHTPRRFEPVFANHGSGG